MKLFLLAAAFLPLLATAQDCKVLRETDPYTKETRLSSGFISLQNVSVTIDADKSEIDFFFTIEGKCFDDASTLVVFFEGTKVKGTYRNAGSMNCDGYFHFRTKNGTVTPATVKKLASQKITQMAFTAADKKQVVITLQPDQQDVFIQSANCVIEEARKLVK